VKRLAEKPEREQTGHSPNNRCSGPVLLSSWLHGAAPRQPSCHPPRKLGSYRPLSYPLGAGVPLVHRTAGVGIGI
jgi:hypothetical protein